MGKAVAAEAVPAVLLGAPQGFQDRASILLRASGIWSEEIELGLTDTQRGLACGALLYVRDELSGSGIEFSDGAGDIDIVETAEGIQSLSGKFGKAAIRQAVCEKFLVLPGIWADADYRRRPHPVKSVPEILQSAGDGIIYHDDPAQIELHEDAHDIAGFISEILDGVNADRQKAALERSMTCISAKAAVTVSALLCGGSKDYIRQFTGYSETAVDEGIAEFEEMFLLQLNGIFDPIKYFSSHNLLMSEVYNPLYLAAHIGIEADSAERLQSVSDRLLAWLEVQPFDEKTKGLVAGMCGLNANVHMPLIAASKVYGAGYDKAKSTIAGLTDYSPVVARAVLDLYEALDVEDKDAEITFKFIGGNCLADPDALFVKGAKQNVAKRICDGCPIRAQCLAFSLARDEEFGVWGGVTERERRARIKATIEGMQNWAKNVLNAVGYDLAA